MAAQQQPNAQRTDTANRGYNGSGHCGSLRTGHGEISQVLDLDKLSGYRPLFLRSADRI